jgi:hypothetical protein
MILQRNSRSNRRFVSQNNIRLPPRINFHEDVDSTWDDGAEEPLEDEREPQMVWAMAYYAVVQNNAVEDVDGGTQAELPRVDMRR